MGLKVYMDELHRKYKTQSKISAIYPSVIQTNYDIVKAYSLKLKGSLEGVGSTFKSNYHYQTPKIPSK